MRQYLRETRSPRTSVLLIVPLLLFYQVGILATGGVVNAVDLLSIHLVRLAGGSTLGYLLASLGLCGGLLGVSYLSGPRRTSPFRGALLVPFLLEATGWAVLMGGVIGLVMDAMPLAAAARDGGPFQNLVMSVGAGVHEEIVFRLLLLGGGTAVLAHWLGPGVAFALALPVASVLFSAVHYVGPLGDPFSMESFVFRWLAGCYFGLIYRIRGLGMAVWTHALYDIRVLVL